MSIVIDSKLWGVILWNSVTKWFRTHAMSSTFVVCEKSTSAYLEYQSTLLLTVTILYSREGKWKIVKISLERRYSRG